MYKFLNIAFSLTIYLVEFFALKSESTIHLVILIIFLLLSCLLSVFLTIDYFHLNAFVSSELKNANDAKKKSRKTRSKKNDDGLNLEDDIDG